MKNPILVPEFREYFFRNNIQALRDAWKVEDPATFPKPSLRAHESATTFKPSINEQSSLQPDEGGLRHA
jgi:hypothetical protein